MQESDADTKEYKVKISNNKCIQNNDNTQRMQRMKKKKRKSLNNP
jgi:hypothetical protein